jgi:hypothetical protein
VQLGQAVRSYGVLWRRGVLRDRRVHGGQGLLGRLGLHWVGLLWAGLLCVGLLWAGLLCVGLRCAGLFWIGLLWGGQGRGQPG